MSGNTLNDHYPFTAVVGMDLAKKAIECIAVNPLIRTVLIRGCSGSAKTVLARSISGLFENRHLIELPLNTTEEQLFGGIDIEATIRSGEPVVQRGLLGRADGNILYADDVNLLDQKMLAQLMDCVQKGSVILEREGVSSSYQCDTIFIATMNPEDCDISAHLLDRFDICAYSDGNEDKNVNEEIVRRNLDYLKDRRRFIDSYSSTESELYHNIAKGKELLQYVSVSDELMSLTVQLCDSVGAEGHRGDISMINTACALAALNNRDCVNKKDIEEASILCLPHRRNYNPPPPEPPQQNESKDQENDEQEPDQDHNEQRPNKEDNGGEGNEHEDKPRDDQDRPEDREDDLNTTLQEMVFEIGDQFRVIDYLGQSHDKVSKTNSIRGRRSLTESSDHSGTYVKYRIPNGMTTDIAFDATIRAAAPYQKGRTKNGLSISIEKSDIREKVRQRRCGCTILFLVDASGSLGVRKRMTVVKGTILSMLKDSYVKRDRIGMMAFRRDSSELILPPTKSVEYSYSQLEQLPTGGKTPLSEALVKVEAFMTAYSRSHQGEKCYIVLLTDGRSNVPLTEGKNANEEVRDIAKKISIPNVNWIVIDTSSGYLRFDNAMLLAKDLSAVYFNLEDLNADTLEHNVRSVIG